MSAVFSLCACGTGYRDLPVTEFEENMDRALIVQRFSTENPGYDTEGMQLTEGLYFGWRAYPEDFDDSGKMKTVFTIYADGIPIADSTGTSLYLKDADPDAVYSVQGDCDTSESEPVQAFSKNYEEYTLFTPADQGMPDGTSTSYTANDMSVGDVNGDGKEELIVEWMPDNEKDNSERGYTGTTFLDTYCLNRKEGTAYLLSRIDMGINIRSGDHYTQFLVWDFDGDGKAELAAKTAPGTTVYSTTDGTDRTLQENACLGGKESGKDYRNDEGMVPEGAEYFTIFDLENGCVEDSVKYEPERGNSSDWGDDYGNRSERYLAAVAYTDGEHPAAIMCRGYYTRTALTAYGMKDSDGDGIGDKIVTLWKYDTKTNEGPEGQGGHNLGIADIDGDGKDEILYCSSAFDHDGTLLYSTGLGHGDVTIVSDLATWNEGMEVFAIHEEKNLEYQVEIHDALTGEILLGYPVKDTDVGRGLAADIDPSHKGAEFWASKGLSGYSEGLWNSMDSDVFASENIELTILSEASSPSKDIALYWDGDLAQELLDHTYDEEEQQCTSVYLSKWNPETSKADVLFSSTEISTSNRTKGNVGLVVDLYGDWREEFIVKCMDDPSKVRIYTTGYETKYVFPCLMSNRMYREGIAKENVGYNVHGYAEHFLSDSFTVK